MTCLGNKAGKSEKSLSGSDGSSGRHGSPLPPVHVIFGVVGQDRVDLLFNFRSPFLVEIQSFQVLIDLFNSRKT